MDGNRIKAARKAKGMTLQDLADKVGVAVSNIHRWETNKGEPHPANLKKLSKALRIPVEEILAEPVTSNVTE